MDSQEILNRLMLAYGVSSQKSLAEALAIPANNISGWLQRGSVPGNPIIKCALDTDTDLRWLVTGEFANANINHVTTRSILPRSMKGKALIERMLSSGGKAVLQRIMNAYGFTTQKELSEYLGISTGTISTWVRREYFPGDLVITCALDTAASLEWLATGEHFTNGLLKQQAASVMPTIPKKILLAGKLEDDGFCYIDPSFVPETVNIESLSYVRSGKSAYLIEIGVSEVSNGTWLLDIDGTLDVYVISKRPGNKLRIIGHDEEFECLTTEVTAKGLVVVILKNTL